MFTTFKPNNKLLKKYIDCYYVDIKHDNTVDVFDDRVAIKVGGKQLTMTRGHTTITTDK